MRSADIFLKDEKVGVVVGSMHGEKIFFHLPGLATGVSEGLVSDFVKVGYFSLSYVTLSVIIPSIYKEGFRRSMDGR